MTDYSDSPTISTSEGSSYIEDALNAVENEGVVYRFYRDDQDPTGADPEWLEEHKDNLPPPAALLIPVDIFEEFLALREQALKPRIDTATSVFNTATASLELQQKEHQTAQVAMYPREEAVKLALRAIESSNSHPTATNVLEMAEHIYHYLTEGKQPCPQLTPAYTPS